ncbi:hypothetical protein Smp_026670 [Schistosoma mansoni]|uniref:hypothetical protein n=1 Tax=Schistosoma mansoni TaxID=6183 RepID=UPI0001A6419C|nr:hypothetical protein Smp_026670 [Schistosoma mansoni]|eukprot:XP_018645838.1 hypothetical protein Smp_026670 [Schistosoma mansoni]
MLFCEVNYQEIKLIITKPRDQLIKCSTEAVNDYNSSTGSYETFRAIIVRIGFICFTCTAIVSVVKEKQDGRFWLLTLTIIPLLIDLIIAINAYVSGKSVTPTISKWFSLCNFTYLICACPPIWIIELHHMDQVNNASALFELMATKNHTPIITVPAWINKVPSIISRENESMMIMGTEIEEFMNSAYLTTTEPQRTRRMTRNTFIHEVLSNETIGLQVSMDVLQSLQLHNFSLKERIRILEQLLLLSVIVGRWLMPREGLTRDQLSQLLLINIGTAADILELFEAFNEQEVRRNDFLRTVILSLWQASLLQFLSQNDFMDNSNNVNCPLIGGCLLLCHERPCLCCETELWAIGISLMLQDLPFLILRITLIVYYNVKSYSNVFFTCKNTLLILLQVFRSIVILSEAGKFNQL